MKPKENFKKQKARNKGTERIMLKCVMCDEEAEYIHAGMSMCKKHFKWAINQQKKPQ